MRKDFGLELNNIFKFKKFEKKLYKYNIYYVLKIPQKIININNFSVSILNISEASKKF